MADPAYQVTNGGATGLWVFVYSGPTTSVGGLASLLDVVCVGLNQLLLPAATYVSWFRIAPALATIQQIESGDILSAAVPAGQKVFAQV